MSIILSCIKQAFMNLILLGGIPFLWWFFRHRKKQKLHAFLGLTRPRLKRSLGVLVIFILVYLFFYNDGFGLTNMFDLATGTEQLVESGASQDERYAGGQLAGIIGAFIINMFANGFCEELLFRGFILKRIKKITGSWPAIIITGIIFGLMHNGLYLLAGITDMNIQLYTFLVTAPLGILLGICSEEVFDGSVVPSMLIHGIGNFWVSLKGFI